MRTAVKRMTGEIYGEKIDMLVCVLDADRYLAEDGRIWTQKQIDANNLRISNTRNVPPEARKVFEWWAKVVHDQDLIKTKIDDLKYDLKLLEYDFNDFPAKLATARGRLTRREFERAFVSALPDDVQKAMERYDFQCEYPTGIPYSRSDLYVSHWDVIEKYFPESSFTYLEYDGCLFLRDDAEKDPYYQKYLKEYRRELPVKAKLEDCLDIGDKNSLYYTATYHIPVTKPFTKTYAEELAKKFAGQRK